MNQPQEDALKKAVDLLREHFEAAVLVVANDVTEDRSQPPRVIWHGGFLPCLAMSLKAHHTIDEAEADDENEED